MEKQLRRYKRRLKDHHKERPNPVELLEASRILASDDANEDSSQIHCNL